MASRDSQGRLSDQQWQQLFERFEASAQTVQDFCQSQGLSVSNFYRRRALAGAPCGQVRSANRVGHKSHLAPVSSGFLDLGHLSTPLPPAPQASGPTLSVRIDLGGGVILQIERS